MRKKGVNALELIFTLFILIIVVLVVVNLFTKSMGKIAPTLETEQQAWLKLHGYTKAKAVCDNLCDQYSTSYSLQDAVAFCKQVSDIDLDGDLKSTENHGGVMPDGIPACEKHVYCFHIKKDCTVGLALSPQRCWEMMCEYYRTYYGISDSDSQKLIQNFINPGQCTIKDKPLGKDQNWWYSLAKFNAVDCTGTGGGATTSTTTTTISELQFSCSKSDTNKITCSWSGCSADVTVIIRPGNKICGTSSQSSGSCNYGPLTSGTYTGLLVCGTTMKESAGVVIS